MPSDLFGDLKQNVARFKVAHAAPRKKIGSVQRPRIVHSPPVPQEPLSAEMTERIQRRQWARYLAWAFEELERWRDRIPASAYDIQRERLIEQRTALLALERQEST